MPYPVLLVIFQENPRIKSFLIHQKISFDLMGVFAIN